MGEECPHCSTKIFPLRDVCPECGGEAKEPYTFSGHGTIYSYTTIQEGPAGFENSGPYTVALIIQLEEGPVVTAQLTDMGDQPVTIGMPVEMVTRRIRSDGDEKGIIVYGNKFRPVEFDKKSQAN